MRPMLDTAAISLRYLVARGACDGFSIIVENSTGRSTDEAGGQVSLDGGWPDGGFGHIFAINRSTEQ